MENQATRDSTKGCIIEANKFIAQQLLEKDYIQLKMTVIGIDLGTTNTCVSVFVKGRLEVFENERGERTTPSCVAFTNVDFIVGKEAKRNTFVDPRNTIFDAKRLIGRAYTDDHAIEDMRYWPFVIENDDGKPTIRVSYLNKQERLIPEEISALILRKMKEIAEEKLGEKVNRAVITVPAYFNDNQRQATKESAIIAGLNVARLINEPTAAAIAFALDNRREKRSEKSSNLLVYDLGGGTFDVSILSVHKGNIEVKAVNGDTHLGGSDFDNKVLDYFLDEIKEKHKKDLRTAKYAKSVAKLRQACEEVKKSLSCKSRYQAQIAIDALFDGKDFVSEISRATFDEICDNLMRKTLILIEKALRDAKLTKKDIDDVLLVGGSTRILKIQYLVSEFFDGKELNKSVNPEEAVACGAAIQAALLDKMKDELVSGIRLRDVTALSYGVETVGGLMSVIIPRNTPYPTKRHKEFTTCEDNQTSMSINIYQGERKLVKDNYLLGTYKVEGLPAKWKGEINVEDTMEIDENGILSVSSIEKSTGVSANIKLCSLMERVSEKKIRKLVIEAESRQKADNKNKARITAKNELESLLYDLKHTVCEDFTKREVSEELKRAVNDMVAEVSQWVSSNSKASKQEFEIKIRYLRGQLRLVSSREVPLKVSPNIKISDSRANVSENKIKTEINMRDDKGKISFAKKTKTKDSDCNARIAAKMELESLLYDLKLSVGENFNGSDEIKGHVNNVVSEVLQWMASKFEASKEELYLKIRYLQRQRKLLKCNEESTSSSENSIFTDTKANNEQQKLMKGDHEYFIKTEDFETKETSENELESRLLPDSNLKAKIEDVEPSRQQECDTIRNDSCLLS